MTAFDLSTTSGIAFHLASANAGHMYCHDDTRLCDPLVFLAATGFDDDYYTIYFSNLLSGQPSREGSMPTPSGFDWAPANDGLPTGVPLLNTQSKTAGIFNFHASTDRMQPSISLVTRHMVRPCTRAPR